jgi:hypothetical protein
MFGRTFVLHGFGALTSVEGLAFEVAQGEAAPVLRPGTVAVALGLEDGVDKGAVADDGAFR